MEMEAFAGRRVLVVGGGDSAIESAIGLSRQPGTQVTLSYRGESFSRLAPRNASRIDEAVSAGRVRLMLGSQVRRITGDEATVETAAGTMDLPNDDVIVRIGGQPPDDFLRRVGVRMVKKDLRLNAASESAGA
jgi:thioredoxin reductase